MKRRIYNFTNHDICVFETKDLIINESRDVNTYRLKNSDVHPINILPYEQRMNTYDIPQYHVSFYDNTPFVFPTGTDACFDVLPLNSYELQCADAIVVSRKFAENVINNRCCSPFLFELADKLYVTVGMVKEGKETIGCNALAKVAPFQLPSYYLAQYYATGVITLIILEALRFYTTRMHLLQNQPEELNAFYTLQHIVNQL